MPHICETCSHAFRFDFPPTSGGSDDGVHCKSPQMADECRGCATGNAVLLWRVEIISDDAKCPHWARAN